MINIPENLFGHKLSSWIDNQYLSSKNTPDEPIIVFLHRLLNCQLEGSTDNRRLYIADFKPNEDDISIIRDNSLENNDNIANMIVTPKNIDIAIERISDVLASAINMAIHQGFKMQEINEYLI